MLAALFSLLALAGLAVLTALLADGVRVLLARRRREAARRPLSLVVAERREIGDRLLVLSLRRPRGGSLPRFSAGQHVLLQVPAGRDGRMQQRAYSLAAWTDRPGHYELGIKREEHGVVSSWLWSHLAAGSRVAVLPPRGDFVLQAGAGQDAEIVLVGGGIGITPMRAMLHAALAGGGQRIVLFHAARHAAELLYREEFQRLAGARLAYHPLLSRPGPDWQGAHGRLDATRILACVARPARAVFHLCATGEMMATLRTGLIAHGIDPARIHQEAFGIAATAGAAGQRIVLEATAGRQEIVTAGEPTLLATLETHDCAPPAECRAGTCGACRMRLLDGEVRWLTAGQADLADGEILPCICAAVGDLRLGVNGGER